MKTFVVVDSSTPLVSIEVAWPVGTLWDPPGLDGVTSMAADAVVLGTKKRKRRELMEALDRIGAELDVSAGKESVVLRGEVVARHAEQFIDLVVEVVREPAFDSGEVEQLRKRVLAELVQIREHDAVLCGVSHQHHVWRGHPYGRPERGALHSLLRMTPDDLAARWEHMALRDGVVVGVAGRVTESEAERFAERIRQACREGHVAPLEVQAAPPQGLDVLIVDHPGRTQAHVAWGVRSVSCLHPDLLALLVANTAFGGTFTSLLTQEIRERRGWSYGASSALRAGRLAGELVVRYAPAAEYLADALQVGYELLERLARGDLPAHSIEAAQHHLVNSAPFRVETAARRLGELVAAAVRGLPDDYVDSFAQRVASLDPAGVVDAARRHIDLGAVFLTVVTPRGEALAEVLRGWPGDPSVSVKAYTDYPLALGDAVA